MTTNASLIRAHLLHLRRADARPDTIRHREDNLWRFVATLTVDLEQVDEETLHRWQDDLRARLSVASVRCYSSHVRVFYAWAAREGHIDRNPAADLKPPRVPAGRARPIAEDRLRIAIACAPEPVKTWLILAAYCGLRAGEISRLTRDAIGDDVLDVDGKGGKPRTVPLPPEVRAVLVAQVHGPGPIWRHRAGRALNPHDVSIDCARHLAATGAECSLHKLRHRYATRLYELSRDPMMVKELLGHASLSTTQIYLGVSAEKGRKMSAKLAQGLRDRRSSGRDTTRPGWSASTEEAA